MTYEKLINESATQQLEDNEYRINGEVVEVKTADGWDKECDVDEHDDVKKVREDGMWEVVYTDDVRYKKNWEKDALYVPLENPFDPVAVKTIYDENGDFVADDLKKQTDDIYDLISSDNLYVDDIENPSELVVKESSGLSISILFESLSNEDKIFTILTALLSIFNIFVLGVVFTVLSVIAIAFVLYYITRKIWYTDSTSTESYEL